MEKYGIIPGGYKPPHAGHYNMAIWLATNTDADKIIIKIGSKARDGVTREESIKLWDLYKDSDPNPASKKLEILPSENPSPVTDAYEFIDKIAPEGSLVYLGLGEKDEADKRFNNVYKYAEPRNIQVEKIFIPTQAGGVSGTQMREYIANNDKKNFQKYLPSHLNTEQKDLAWNLVTKEESGEVQNVLEGFELYEIPNNQPLNIEAKGYRAGVFNPDQPAETIKDRLSPIAKSKVGLLGTGYYYFGNIEDAKNLRDTSGYEGLSEIDLSKYNLFQPDDPQGFYNNLKEVTYYLSTLKKEDLKDPEVIDNIEDAVEGFSSYIKLDKNKVQKAFLSFIEDIIKGNDGDLLSNRMMDKIYDGIDFSNTSLDNFGVGSVIFKGKLKKGTYGPAEENEINEEKKEYNKLEFYKKYYTNLTPTPFKVNIKDDDIVISGIKKEQVNEEKIPGGLAKGLSIKDLAKKHKLPVEDIKKQLEKGIKVELEHTTSKQVAREIAMDHVFEDPKYYDKLSTIEEIGGATMNDQEKKAHQTKLNKLKKVMDKQGDKYVEYPKLPNTVIGVKNVYKEIISKDFWKKIFENPQVKEKFDKVINEIGDATLSFDYEPIEKFNNDYATSFKIDDNTTITVGAMVYPNSMIKEQLRVLGINTPLNKNDKGLDFEFNVRGLGYDKPEEIDLNKGQLYKTMGTIVNILKDIVSKEPDIRFIFFMASKGGKGKGGEQRRNLYNAYLKKQLPQAKIIFSGPIGYKADAGAIYDLKPNQTNINEGGAAGHMAHPFDLPQVKTGKDLLNIFKQTVTSLKSTPASLKIDGVNASIRLINTENGKTFALDRGSKKELDLKGVTKNDLEVRFGQGHGMIVIGNQVLDLFNEALPSIKPALEKLGLWNNPNIMLNIEYVAGKTNVQDYGKNFLAIHGLLEVKEIEKQGARGTITQRVTSEYSYSDSDIQLLLKELEPIAKKQGFEVYGSVPTTLEKEPNFSSVLSQTYSVEYSDKTETKSLNQWLSEIKVPEGETVTINIDGVKKKIAAISKQVYFSILNGEKVDDLFDTEDDIQKAIGGFVTYLATEKLGDAILDVTSSPMGGGNEHEGLVIRDPKISPNPFKITGKFITQGVQSAFRNEGVDLEGYIKYKFNENTEFRVKINKNLNERFKVEIVEEDGKTYQFIEYNPSIKKKLKESNLSNTAISKDGEPIIVWRAQKDDRKQGVERAGGNRGIYFSANKDSVKIYGGNIKPYHLNIKNPIVLKDKEWYLSSMSETTYEWLIRQGYDGAIWLRNGEMYEIIAFYPEQVIPINNINEGMYDQIIGQTIKRMWPSIKISKTLDVPTIEGYKVFELPVKSNRLDFNLITYVKRDKDLAKPYVVHAEAAPEDSEIYIYIVLREEEKVYSDIQADLRDLLRHEIEHLTQSGPNARIGKGEIDDKLRQKIMMNTDNPEIAYQYYLLPDEIPAMVQGIYNKAKTQKIPFVQAVENYLDQAEDENWILPKHRNIIKKTWFKYAKVNLPKAQGL